MSNPNMQMNRKFLAIFSLFLNFDSTRVYLVKQNPQGEASVFVCAKTTKYTKKTLSKLPIIMIFESVR